MKRVLVAIFATLFVLSIASCAPGDATSSDASKTVNNAPAKPAFDKTGYAQAIEAAYVASNGRPVTESCDDAYTAWQCYYDGIEAKSESRVDIKMTTPGDITKSAAADMSKKARMAYFNFVGEQFPDLDTIVTFVNGVDTGTTYRDDVPMLNK